MKKTAIIIGVIVIIAIGAYFMNSKSNSDNGIHSHDGGNLHSH